MDELSSVSILKQKEMIYNRFHESLLLDNVYIFGTGQLGMFVYDQFCKNDVQIAGFIDNNTSRQGTVIQSAKVFALSDVNKGAHIVIASLIAWSEIEAQLRESEYENVVCYEVLALLDNRFLTWNSSFVNLLDETIKHKKELITLYDLFADAKSRQIFDLIIGHRLHLNIELTRQAHNMSLQDGKQYFDSIVPSKVNEVFANVGGFDGTDVLNFVEWKHSKDGGGTRRYSFSNLVA